jgi:gamma-glutamyl hercynylcysteine S-oxide synthase
VVDSLSDSLLDARRRLLELVVDLDDAQWMGPHLPIVNPIRWEIAHVAWFQERWVLRHALAEPPLREDGDALYDSSHVPHDTRWDLPLPDRRETLAYLERTLARTLAARARSKDDYFFELALAHEDMHAEAIAYTRQTLAYAEPALAIERAAIERAGPWPGDVTVPGGTLRLGAPEGTSFVFDNEKWAHPVEVLPFRIARAPVTNAMFAEMVAAGGYRDRRLWSEAGWAWRTRVGAERPVYWNEDGSMRRYDRIVDVPPHEPIVHVSWFEAEAFCAFADRRLPTEAEWEFAAGGLEKRRFPWGDSPPTPRVANVDMRARGPIDVAALPDGDSPFGCRQMIGNVWEWTATDFAPYPGFVIDPYADYSAPWFGTHKVLRGGCWATRGRLLRNTWRNFYPPDRRDVLAGFRTCALHV